MGGIGLLNCFGFGTPSVIIFRISAKLPSVHKYFCFVRSGPRGVPVPLTPWQPVHVAPPTCPWEIRSPSAIIFGDEPSGTGMSAVLLAGGWVDDWTTLPAGAERLGHGVGFGAGPVGSPR